MKTRLIAKCVTGYPLWMLLKEVPYSSIGTARTERRHKPAPLTTIERKADLLKFFNHE